MSGLVVASGACQMIDQPFTYKTNLYYINMRRGNYRIEQVVSPLRWRLTRLIHPRWYVFKMFHVLRQPDRYESR